MRRIKLINRARLLMVNILTRIARCLRYIWINFDPVLRAICPDMDLRFNVAGVVQTARFYKRHSRLRGQNRFDWRPAFSAKMPLHHITGI